MTKQIVLHWLAIDRDGVPEGMDKEVEEPGGHGGWTSNGQGRGAGREAAHAAATMAAQTAFENHPTA